MSILNWNVIDQQIVKGVERDGFVVYDVGNEFCLYFGDKVAIALGVGKDGWLQKSIIDPLKALKIEIKFNYLKPEDEFLRGTLPNTHFLHRLKIVGTVNKATANILNNIVNAILAQSMQGK